MLARESLTVLGGRQQRRLLDNALIAGASRFASNCLLYNNGGPRLPPAAFVCSARASLVVSSPLPPRELRVYLSGPAVRFVFFAARGIISLAVSRYGALGSHQTCAFKYRSSSVALSQVGSLSERNGAS